MGNLIQQNNDSNYHCKIVKVSSESITPRYVDRSNKMDIKYINTIHHRKTIKELENNNFNKINKARNLNNIKKYLHLKSTRNLSEADKNNHIVITNSSSNNKNILSKNSQHEDNSCYLVNSNLYEFEIDSSSSEKNIINTSSKKENLINKSSIKNAQIQKKNITKSNSKNLVMISISEKFKSTEKTIINESDYSLNDTNFDNNNNKTNNNNEKKIEIEKNYEIAEKKSKILNNFIVNGNFEEKDVKINSGVKIETNNELKAPKKIDYLLSNKSNNIDTIKPINSFIYCQTAPNIFKPKKLFEANISIYSKNNFINPQKFLRNEIKSPKTSNNKIAKNTSEIKKINPNSNKKLFKKNIGKKYNKKIKINYRNEINNTTNSLSFNDTNNNSDANSTFYLNESQKNQKFKQIIEKISDNKFKNENINKSTNSYSNNEPSTLQYSKLKNILNISYDNKMILSNSMKISNQSNISYCPNLSQNQNFKNSMKKGIFFRKKILLKNSNLSSCKIKKTPIKKLSINLFDDKINNNNNNSNDNLIVKNILLSNLIDEQIYFQSEIKKLKYLNYFLINVKNSEYETEINTHDVLCLISDKYLTTIDKNENCCIPKKVIKIDTIKKLKIISIRMKKNINYNYVVIIICNCYSNEIQEIKEIEEGLLIEKKKDVDDLVEVLAKLINDLEILYL